jgi:SAM-dependent methyltransferase
MAADDRPAGRARSFGRVAEAYDRFRPAPPAAAVEWVLPEPCTTALDLGAGTGALTRRLVGRSARVLAVEPDPGMLGVLTARSPGVGAIRAAAEHLPVAPSAVDAVTVSSAWHWMDAGPALAEIGRVLRPGGVLGVVWNGADRSVEWVGSLLGRRDPSPGEGEVGAARHRFELPAGSLFADLETTVIAWSQPMSRDQLVGLAGTYSSVITMDAGPKAAELARIGARMDAHLGAGGDVVELPLACRCWRAVRR